MAARVFLVEHPGTEQMRADLAASLARRGISVETLPPTAPVPSQGRVVHCIADHRVGNADPLVPGVDALALTRAGLDVVQHPNRVSILVVAKAFNDFATQVADDQSFPNFLAGDTKREAKTVTQSFPEMLRAYLPGVSYESDPQQLVDDLASGRPLDVRVAEAAHKGFGHSGFLGGSMGAIGKIWRSEFARLFADAGGDPATLFDPTLPKGVPYDERARRWEQTGKDISRAVVVYLSDRRGDNPDLNRSGLSVFFDIGTDCRSCSSTGSDRGNRRPGIVRKISRGRRNARVTRPRSPEQTANAKQWRRSRANGQSDFRVAQSLTVST